MTRLPSCGILVARIYLGVALFLGGLSKVEKGFSDGRKLADITRKWLSEGSPYDFFEPFLHEVVLPHPALFAFLVAWGELVGGACLALGLITRPAALGALVLVVAICLASGETFWRAGTAPAFCALALAVLIVGGRFGGLDGWLQRRLPRWLA
jgi:uncharacterized membrane protein YphA (DoxX/SURF4 family)